MQDDDEGTTDLSSERRRRQGLRALVDEMLTEIRAATVAREWTAEERRIAIADLARIMSTVQREVFPEEGGEPHDDLAARRDRTNK